MNRKSDYEMFVERLVEDYGLTQEQAIEIANGLDNTKLYECTEDRQGGEFGIGRIQTELEWGLTALEWSVGGGLEEEGNQEETLANFKAIFKHNYLIPFIDDLWEVTIEEHKEN